MKAIMTKYLGPTDRRGSRIKATDSDGNNLVQGYDSALNSDDNHKAAAKALRDKMGWKGRMIGGWVGNEMAFVFEDGRYEIPA